MLQRVAASSCLFFLTASVRINQRLRVGEKLESQNRYRSVAQSEEDVIEWDTGFDTEAALEEAGTLTKAVESFSEDKKDDDKLSEFRMENPKANVQLVQDKFSLWTSLKVSVNLASAVQFAIALEVTAFLLYVIVRALADPHLMAVLVTVLSVVLTSKTAKILLDALSFAWTVIGSDLTAGVTQAAVAARNAVINRVPETVRRASRALADRFTLAGEQTAAAFRALTRKGYDKVEGVEEDPPGDPSKLDPSKFKEYTEAVFTKLKASLVKTVNDLKAEEKTVGTKIANVIAAVKNAYVSCAIEFVQALVMEPISATIMAILYLEFTLGRAVVRGLYNGVKNLATTLREGFTAGKTNFRKTFRTIEVDGDAEDARDNLRSTV